MPVDVAKHFDWQDTESGAASETQDPHVIACVDDLTIQVDAGGAMLVLDNRYGLEGGKRVAETALDWIFELGDALGSKPEPALTVEQALTAFLAHVDERVSAGALHAATRLRIVNSVRQLDRAFGRRPCVDVLPADTREHATARIAAGAHLHTAQREIAVLVRALRYAAQTGLYTPRHEPVALLFRTNVARILSCEFAPSGQTLVWVEGRAEPFAVPGDHRETIRRALEALGSVADDAEALAKIRGELDELNTTVSFLLESSAQTLNTSTAGFKSASELVDIVNDLSKRVDGLQRAVFPVLVAGA